MAEEKEPLGFGIERFEGFEGFERFEAFGGSIRQFRASRKRKTWLATAASSAPEKEPLGLPQPQIWQLQEPVWHVWRGSGGVCRVWMEHAAVSGQLKQKDLACHSR